MLHRFTFLSFIICYHLQVRRADVFKFETYQAGSLETKLLIFRPSKTTTHFFKGLEGHIFIFLHVLINISVTINSIAKILSMWKKI